MPANLSQRTCIGCHHKKPMTELIRVVVDNAGIVKVNHQNKGRGAYLCKTEKTKISDECLQQAMRKNAFKHAFKRKINSISITASSSSSHLGPC